jgi:N-acetylglutamate synthase-like GNAT family acetyltransferase
LAASVQRRRGGAHGGAARAALTLSIIRRAAIGDAAAIAALLHQLGYDVPAEELRRRLKRRGPLREVFVALRDDDVVGWAAVGVEEPFVEGRGALLEGLVVDEATRSAGIGEQLLEAAEGWARARGCAEMRVLSNVVRERAHEFYRRHGYATVKAQHRFQKRL